MTLAPQAPHCALFPPLALALALSLASCGTAEKRAREYALAHPAKLAGWCADRFPVRPVEPSLIPGTPAVIEVDTLRLRADCPDGTQTDCPPSVTRTVLRTDTLLRVDTLRVRDSAAEAARLERSETAREREREATERWRGRFWWALLAAMGAGAALFFLKKQ